MAIIATNTHFTLEVVCVIRAALERAFDRADIQLVEGSSVERARPYDIKVLDPRFYRRVLLGGNLALGNSYVDGWWDSENLDLTLQKLLSSGSFMSWYFRSHNELVNWLRSRLANLQTISGSKRVVEEHFDLGNELFVRMLDSNMQYTCGYWKKATTLEEAQRNKVQLISEKLGLRSGMRVAELGGGFGGLARFMAAEYGCRVSMWNISSQQVRFARGLCRDLPVAIHEADYRTASGAYDRIVAIGLCEHIGHKNYRSFFKFVRGLLKTDGLFLMQTIGTTHRGFETEAWTNAHVFPNSSLPTMERLAKAFEPVLVLEDWHNLQLDYARTLRAWRENFDQTWPELKEQFPEKYDSRFQRLWHYYLDFATAAFTSRALNISQFVFSKEGVCDGYQAVR